MNMRTFEHFPEQDKCLLCGKNTDKPCILIGVDGTESCGQFPNVLTNAETGPCARSAG